jgi:hypothetical protein
MKTLEFTKDVDTGRWYVVLPNWTGPKESLEMVMGADTLLDIASENKMGIVRLLISEKPFEGSNELLIKNIDKTEGAFYRLNEFDGKNVDLDIWLCDVTKFVMGGFPKKIYIKKIPPSFDEGNKKTQPTEEIILLQEQTLRRYQEELKRNPDSLFWKGAAKNTKEFIEELKSLR